MYETRVGRVFALFAGAFAVLGLRAFALQVVQRESVLEEHEKRVHGRFVLAPRRGEILYVDGAPIAGNEPGFSVHLDVDSFYAHRWRCDVCGAVTRRAEAPKACPECSSDRGLSCVPPPSGATLAAALHVSEEELGERLLVADAKHAQHPQWRHFPLVDEVDRDTAMAIALAADRFPGVTVRARSGRSVDPAARRVAGRTRPPYEEDVAELTDPDRERVYSRPEIYSMRFGRSGLELAFDDRLRGEPGLASRLPRKDGRAREPQILRPVVDGASLATTLRRGVQTLAQEAVDAAPGDAAAVVLDLRDGAVVGIASQSTDGFDRSVTAIRPGSVYKLVTALALLESGVSPDETVSCAGAGRLPSGRRYTCDASHGELSFRDAFAHSCNAYFATMAERVGADGLMRACVELGMDVNPRLHLTGTPAGLESSPGKLGHWYAADLRLIGIGQGKAEVSPLQVAVAYGRIATGGRRLSPYLIAEEAPGAADTDPELARFAPILSNAAHRVVTSGTGRAVAELVAVDAAGKSGTADINVAGSDNNAWFVAFAPASSPRYVAVVVYQSVPGHGASTVGGSVGRLLAEALR